jgi:hypothetical protein
LKTDEPPVKNSHAPGSPCAKRVGWFEFLSLRQRQIPALFAGLCILLIARRLKGRLQEIGFFFVLAPALAAIFGG